MLGIRASVRALARPDGRRGSSASPLRRYHLLPSQCSSILASYLGPTPKIRYPYIARSSKEALETFEKLQLGHHKGVAVRVSADLIDDSPDEVQLSVAGTSDGQSSPSSSLRGASHVVTSKQEVERIARNLLAPGARAVSALPPHISKPLSSVLVSPCAAPEDDGQTRQLTVSVFCDRSAKPSTRTLADRTPVVFGPSVAISTSQGSRVLAHVDASALARAKKLGEWPGLASADNGGGLADAGVAPQLEDAMRHVCHDVTASVFGGADGAKNVAALGLADDADTVARLRGVVERLVRLFWESDGERFDVTLRFPGDGDGGGGGSGGGEVSLEAVSLSFDDFSLARQPAFKAMRENGSLLFGQARGEGADAKQAEDGASSLTHSLHPLEIESEREGMVYRKHRNGELGLFGYGAGMGMGTLDGVFAEGGKPANFFDGGGGASIKNAYAAMKTLGADQDVRVIFVNIFGGITRTDLVSEGICQAYRQLGIAKPLVVRFRGNKAEEANERLLKAQREEGLDVTICSSLREGARAAKERADALRASSPGGGSGRGVPSAGTRAYSSLARPTLAIHLHDASDARATGGRRHLSTSVARAGIAPASTPAGDRRDPFTFLTGYAFAGKLIHDGPSAEGREGKGEATAGDRTEKSPKRKKQGFGDATPIGRWRDELLRGGDAGEDSLMCARMGVARRKSVAAAAAAATPVTTSSPGDYVIGVADGVGGWSESGIDPALFSQSLMYHATKHAEAYFACPDRMEEDEEGDDVEIGEASSPTSSSSTIASRGSTAPTTPGSSAPTSPGQPSVESSEANHAASAAATAAAGARKAEEAPSAHRGSGTQRDQDPNSSYAGSPVSILRAAYDATLLEPDVVAGSSTACVVTLDASKGILRSANLGDSGFLVLRQGASIVASDFDATRPGERAAASASFASSAAGGNAASGPGGARGAADKSASAATTARPRTVEGLLYASKPLQHGFNTPLQLAKLPVEWRQANSIDSTPRDAATTQGQLRGGDIVVVATDGFFDNVSQTETVAVVKYVREKHAQAWAEQRRARSDAPPTSTATAGSSPSSSNTASAGETSRSDAASDPAAAAAAAPRPIEGPRGRDLDEERDLIQVIAHNLASYAAMCMNSAKSSPFEREAARYGLMYPGGKVDDVAVVCALVVEQ